MNYSLTQYNSGWDHLHGHLRGLPRARAGKHDRRCHHPRQVSPTIDTTQTDLAAGHEAIQQHQHCSLRGQCSLGLHPTAEFLVQPFDDIGGAQAFPVGARVAVVRQGSLRER